MPINIDQVEHRLSKRTMQAVVSHRPYRRRCSNSTMDNQLKKKIKERAQLDQFRSAYPHFPKGKIVASESPDFIIKPNRKRTIGIELIQLYWQEESISQQILLEQIENAIFRKEEKLKRYQKKVLENYWLLITADSLHTINFNLHNLLEKFDFDSSFDKVFLFGEVSEVIFELK